MSVELATGYVSIVPTTKGIAGGLSAILGGPAAQAGEQAGKQAGAGVASGVSSGSSGIGAAIKKNAVLPILGVGVAAFASAKQVEDAQNTIIRTTGATGKAAESLKNSFKNVAGKTPADFGTVATAMAEVSQRTGLTGKALEQLTLQTVTFNRITKDSPLNVQDLTKTLAGFNIPAKDMSKNLDALFKTSQKTGVPLADLVSTLGTAGPIVRQFGIPLQQSAALLAQLDKAGISTNQIIPGLRKAMIGFAKDGKEPGKALKDTLASMDAMIKKGDALGARKLAVQVFGARGAGLVDAAIQGKLKIDDLTNSLDNVKGGKGILDTASATSTLGAKMGVLKNQAELALAEIGKPVLGTFIGLMKSALPVITGIAKGFAALPGPVKTALAGIVAFAVLRGPLGKVASSVTSLAKVGLAAGKGLFAAGKAVASIGVAAIKAAAQIAIQTAAWIAQKVAMLAGAIATKALAVAQLLLNAAMDANPIGLIVIGIAALVAGVILAYQHFGFFRDAVDAVWGAIKTVVSFIIDNWPLALAALTFGMSLVAGFIIDHWNQIVSVITTAINFIWGIITSVVGAIVSFWQAEWSLIVAVVSGIWNFITGIVSGGINLIRTVISGGMAIVKAVWDAAWGGFVGTVTGIISGIAGAVRSVVNTVIRGINVLIRAWNSLEFDVPSIDLGPLGEIGGGTIGTPDLPTIPQLAQGAFVKATPGGSTVRVAEAGMDEAVLPLPKLKDLIALAGATPGQATQTIVYVDAMLADDRAGRRIGEALDKHHANGGTAGTGRRVRGS